MLPQEHRLKKVRDFNLILKNGIFIRGNFLDIKILDLKKVKNFPKRENSEEFKTQLKIAFAVGLKISGSAVKRNRIKRQLREIVRLLLKDQKIKSGYYYGQPRSL